MSLAALFMVCFAVGPMVFHGLLALGAARRGGVALLAGGAALAGLGLRYGWPGSWAQDTGDTLAVLGLLWLSWVAILALFAQTWRLWRPGRRPRRWSAVAGALGTTAPWFGLALAESVAPSLPS